MTGIIAFFVSLLKNWCAITTVAAVALVIPGLTGCADVSPAIGKYYKGRTLHLSVAAMERAPELVYNLDVAAQGSRYYRLAPSEPGLELVMLRMKVENHTATSAIVNIDERAAELRDFFQEKYFPIDINQRAEAVPPPEDIDNVRVARCPVQTPRDVCFLWNTTYTDGTTRSFDLLKGFGINGWLIFEAPEDTEFQDLRWRAGDGITIGF